MLKHALRGLLAVTLGAFFYGIILAILAVGTPDTGYATPSGFPEAFLSWFPPLGLPAFIALCWISLGHANARDAKIVTLVVGVILFAAAALVFMETLR